MVRGLVLSSREQAVVARMRLELGDPAVRVVEVAEDDRVGRAGLRAGGSTMPSGMVSLALVLAPGCLASLMRCTQ